MEYLVKEKEFEGVLVKLICCGKEGEFIMEMANLTWQIMQFTSEKYGHKAL